jgi:hypothetical protein
LLGGMLLVYASRDYILAANVFSESVRQTDLAERERS